MITTRWLAGLTIPLLVATAPLAGVGHAGTSMAPNGKIAFDSSATSCEGKRGVP
jgi:hypothetical protein